MLVVETGEGLPDADSYVDLAEARAVAVKYGFTLPADDTAAEVALRQGAGYVDLQEGAFSGLRLTGAQGLSWPRAGAVTTYGYEIPNNEMPRQLAVAQVAAAAEYGAGVDVRANDDGLAVESKEVTGAVAVSYFNNGKTGKSLSLTKCLDALRPLMTNANNGLMFKVSRA